MTLARRATKSVIESLGWRGGTSLEDSVALFLHRSGLGASVIAQQHPVDKYRLDFAAVDVRIAIEADGWWHRSPEGAAKDRERDSFLRSIGWVVFRVDDQGGEESLRQQVQRAARIIHLERATGTKWRQHVVRVRAAD